MTSQIPDQQFNASAALAAVLIIIKRCRELRYDTTRHRVLKLLYLAEKLHLERYGRLIVGDRYYALEYGPVATHVYDAIKSVAGERVYHLSNQDLEDGFKRCIEVKGRYLTALCEPNLDNLSDSDISCLEEAIGKYGALSFGKLTDLSHDDAWRQTVDGSPISLEQIVRTLPNVEVLLAYLRDPYPDRNGPPN